MQTSVKVSECKGCSGETSQKGLVRSSHNVKGPSPYLRRTQSDLTNKKISLNTEKEEVGVPPVGSIDISKRENKAENTRLWNKSNLLKLRKCLIDTHDSLTSYRMFELFESVFNDPLKWSEIIYFLETNYLITSDDVRSINHDPLKKPMNFCLFLAEVLSPLILKAMISFIDQKVYLAHFQEISKIKSLTESSENRVSSDIVPDKAETDEGSCNDPCFLLSQEIQRELFENFGEVPEDPISKEMIINYVKFRIKISPIELNRYKIYTYLLRIMHPDRLEDRHSDKFVKALIQIKHEDFVKRLKKNYSF